MSKNPAPKDPKRELARLARAIRARRIENHDLAWLSPAGLPATVLPPQATQLKVALDTLDRTSTDIARALKQLPGHALDTAALQHISPALLRRIERRLRRLPQRLNKTEPMIQTARPAATSSESQPDKAFRCVDAYNRCRAQSTDPAFWCHIALGVCLARALLRAALNSDAR